MTREVAIVGGSAAGLFLARTFALQNYPVRVFEGAPSVDPEARTLIVTSRMREILGPLEHGSVVNEITHFELFTDGRSATVPLRRPDLVVERSTLIKGLAESASAAGACVLPGHRVQDLAQDGDRLALTVEKKGARETVRADLVVGADGVSSRVARAAGWPPQPTVPLLQALVKWPSHIPHDCVRVWFVPDDTPYFYWLIPESKDRGVLGLIAEDASRVRADLDRFLARQGLDAIELQAARVPLYTQWIPIHKRIGQSDVYLVGDACGQVKVTTLGGVVTGFRGALAVADAVLNGGKGDETRGLRRELDRHLLVRRMLHGFTQTDYNRLIDLLDAKARALLGACTRDEAHQMLMRLCLRQPRLLLLAARAFLSRASFPARSA
jgi:digeranylgeranylglycerophospholipid reductase